MYYKFNYGVNMDLHLYTSMFYTLKHLIASLKMANS